MKTTAKKRLYEAMFLADLAETSSDWDGVVTAIEDIIVRAGCEVVSLKKWEERRLAYEIKGKGRGTYVLCYFKAGGSGIQAIERAVQLSEWIMRVLILRADSVRQEDIEKDTPAMKAERQREIGADTKLEATKEQDVDEAEQEAGELKPEESAVGANEDQDTAEQERAD